jgi:FixJ family two-component response regulator
MADRLAECGVTSRELEILVALSEHLTNAEIAARFFVSERTVESHVSSLLRSSYRTPSPWLRVDELFPEEPPSRQ